MKKALATLFLTVALGAMNLFAQQPVAVTGVVTGANGAVYSSGTYQIQLVDASGTPLQSFQVGGGTQTQTQFSGTLSGTGSLAVSLYANTDIGPPAGTQWSFRICSLNPTLNLPLIVTARVCFSQSLTISGAGDVSSALSASAPALYTLNPAGGTSSFPTGSSGITGATSGQALIAGSATTATSSKPLAGSGAGLTTGPTSSTNTDCANFTGTAGQIADSGAPCGGAGITVLTGDGTTPTGGGSQPLTLATVNSSPGACGDATHVCQATTNGKGLVTAQTPVAITAAGGLASLGAIVNATTWASLSGYNTNSTTPTIEAAGSGNCPAGTNSCLLFASGAGASTYNQSLSYNYYTIAQQITETMTVIADTKTSTSFGLPMGLGGWINSTAHTGNGVVAYLDMTSNGTSGQLTIVSLAGATPTVQATSATNLSFSAGDTVVVQLAQTYDHFVASVWDQTTGTIPIIVSAQSSVAPSAGWNAPQIAKPAIYNQGGNQTVTSFVVTSQLPVGADVVVMGLSRAAGWNVSTYGAQYAATYPNGSFGFGYASLLQSSDLITAQYGPLRVLNESVPAGVTQDQLNYLPEVLALKPKVVVLESVYNDLATGVPTGTWQANFASIVSQLQAAGIVVYNLYGAANNGVNQTPYITYVNTNYPGTLLDAGLQNWSANWSAVLNADNVHPNKLGHNIIYKAIAQRLIKDNRATAFATYDFRDKYALTYTSGAAGGYQQNCGIPFQSGVIGSPCSFFNGNGQLQFVFGSNVTAASTVATPIGYFGLSTDASAPSYLRLSVTGSATAALRRFDWQVFGASPTQNGVIALQPGGGNVQLGQVPGGANLGTDIGINTTKTGANNIYFGWWTNEASGSNAALALFFAGSATDSLRKWQLQTRSPSNGNAGILGLQSNGGTIQIGNPCANAASPAVCGSAISGYVVIAAAATTVTVNTTGVSATSQIYLQPTSSTAVGTLLGVTCNTTPTFVAPSAQTAGTSFVITAAVAPVTNPMCIAYWYNN